MVPTTETALKSGPMKKRQTLYIFKFKYCENANILSPNVLIYGLHIPMIYFVEYYALIKICPKMAPQTRRALYALNPPSSSDIRKGRLSSSVADLL